jgi:hypothetical protein
MRKPLAVVLAFEPGDPSIPPSKLSDELIERFRNLMKMPLAERQVEINRIWEKHRVTSR